MNVNADQLKVAPEYKYSANPDHFRSFVDALREVARSLVALEGYA
jgi:hypothetical protein